VPVFVFYLRHFLTLAKPSGLPNMSATAQTDRQLGRNSHLGPLWYGPPLNARSGPDQLGACCHPSYPDRRTGVNACGLTFAYPPTDQGGPNRLFRRGIAGLGGQTRDWNSRLNTRRVNS